MTPPQSTQTDSQRPDDAYVAQLTELADWHREWVLARVDASPFDPTGRPVGSDYNQHYVDLDNDDDEFHAEARRILGVVVEATAAPAAAQAGRHRARPQLATSRQPTAEEIAAGVDFAAHQQAHNDAVTALVADWPDIIAPVIVALAAAAGTAVAAGNLAALGSLSVGVDVVTGVADALAEAMAGLALHAAGQAVAEVAHQGGHITAPPDAGADTATQVAHAVTGVIVNGYASTAARTALQAATPGATAQAVEAAVTSALDDMSTTTTGWVAANLATALSSAQTAGRYAVFDLLPTNTRYVATEVLDSATCKPCLDIDETEYDSLTAAKLDYPIAGYRDCLGGLRCRGLAFPLL